MALEFIYISALVMAFFGSWRCWRDDTPVQWITGLVLTLGGSAMGAGLQDNTRAAGGALALILLAAGLPVLLSLAALVRRIRWRRLRIAVLGAIATMTVYLFVWGSLFTVQDGAPIRIEGGLELINEPTLGGDIVVQFHSAPLPVPTLVVVRAIPTDGRSHRLGAFSRPIHMMPFERGEVSITTLDWDCHVMDVMGYCALRPGEYQIVADYYLRLYRGNWGSSPTDRAFRRVGELIQLDP